MWFSQKCSFFPSWLLLGWSSTVWQLSTTTLTLTTQPIFKQPILIISILVIQRKSFTLLFLYIKGDNVLVNLCLDLWWTSEISFIALR